MVRSTITYQIPEVRHQHQGDAGGHVGGAHPDVPDGGGVELRREDGHNGVGGADAELAQHRQGGGGPLEVVEEVEGQGAGARHPRDDHRQRQGPPPAAFQQDEYADGNGWDLYSTLKDLRRKNLSKNK